VTLAMSCPRGSRLGGISFPVSGPDLFGSALSYIRNEKLQTCAYLLRHICLHITSVEPQRIFVQSDAGDFLKFVNIFESILYRKLNCISSYIFRNGPSCKQQRS
jgi:hypothetical protein